MGPCCCVWAFSSCSKWGPLSSCGVSRLLTVVAYCIAWTLGPEGLVAPPHVESSRKVKVTQWCLTLCEPMDYIVHGILQARILEWVVFPFFTGFSQPRDRTQISHTAGGFFTSWATVFRRILYQLSQSRNSLPDGYFTSQEFLDFDPVDHSLPGSPVLGILQATILDWVGVSASASVLSMNIQDWFPLGRTGWISLQSKGPSRVFYNTTVQNHWFFGTQLSLSSNSHIHTWPLEKPQLWLDGLLSTK